jgi:hypothetical protein
MDTVKDNLIAARALIDTPDKWTQNEYTGFNSALGAQCYCTTGALARVYGKEPSPQSCETGPEYRALRMCLPDGPWFGVVEFNDHPDTTHADIMALFDRAIEAQP